MEKVNDFSAEIREKAKKEYKSEIKNNRFAIGLLIFIILLIVGDYYYQTLHLSFLDDSQVFVGSIISGIVFIVGLAAFLFLLPVKVDEEKLEKYMKEMVKSEKASFMFGVKYREKHLNEASTEEGKDMIRLQIIELKARLEILEDYEFAQEEAKVFGKKA